MQVHQLPVTTQRHKQLASLLAQGVRAAALGDQVRVRRIGAASVAPQAGGTLCCGLLALVLLGLSLVPGLLDTLAQVLTLQQGGRCSAAPGVAGAGFPAAKRSPGQAVQVKHVPAVASAGAVAWDVYAVQMSIRNG